MTTDNYIAQVVAGRSFLDVGPLWITQNEKLSVAAHHGASRVAAMDQMPFENSLWAALDDRLRSMGVQYERVSLDVCRYDGEPFDVLHCAGVLYHHPSPMLLLQRLYAICRHNLILGTVVADRAGGVPLVPGSMIFLPGVPPDRMEALRQEWRPFLGTHAGDIFDHDVRWDANNLYHWWWLFTETAVIGMCRAAGFEIVSGHVEGRLLTMLLSKIS